MNLGPEVRITVGSPEAEANITQISPVSSTPYQEVIACVGLPKKVRGLRILDVGAGASDTTAYLLSQGADAYAVDPRYDDPKLLRSLAMQNIEFLKGHSHKRNEVRAEQTALARFENSFRRFPDRYIASNATSLPFDSNSFDTAFSIRAISAYLDLEVYTFLRAEDECVRVVKPGGNVVLYPYETTSSLHSPQGKMHQQLREQSHSWLGSHLYGRVREAAMIDMVVEGKPRQKIVIVK